MKLLVITRGESDPENVSPADLWRVYRPIRELKKHVDWQIDYQPGIIRDKKGITDPDEWLEKYAEDEAKHLGQYDIVFCSYFTSPHEFALLWATKKQYGTKLVLDIDDDVYHIDSWNPVWLEAGWTGIHFIQKMVEQADYLTTTSEHMRKLISRDNNHVYVLPNYISDDYASGNVNNGEKIVIGYFGGASHYRDVHNTAIIPALRKVMHENKNVEFHIMGQPLDDYLPKKRVRVTEPVKGTGWYEAFSKLDFDIALAPLMDTEFSKGKSDIKWQESTRMGAAFIATDIAPYSLLPDDVLTKVQNTPSAWYDAITKLLDAENRKAQVQAAKKHLEKYRIEDNWHMYKDMFEKVNGA